jgi:hypothetical protein
MASISGKNTKPELIVRKLLFSLGIVIAYIIQTFPASRTWYFPTKEKLFLYTVAFGIDTTAAKEIPCLIITTNSGRRSSQIM